MAVTLTAEQWQAFYADNNFWPEGRYHDDHIILLNGERSDIPTAEPESMKPADQVTVEYGSVMNRGAVYFTDLVDYTQEWLDKQTKTQLVLQVPNEKLDDLLKLLEASDVEIRSKGVYWV